MEQLQFIISKKEKPAPHERAYWTDLISKMIDRPIKQVLGYTRNWTIPMIKDCYLTAMSKQTLESKRKYFWWYRKQTNL